MTYTNAHDNDQILYVDEDFVEPSEDDIFELNRNQYNDEIRRIIETHTANWIPYHPRESQNSNPLDIDDHIAISSIERI